MRYCSLADLQLAIPSHVLQQLSNDDASGDTINEAVVEEAVRQAEEVVDAHLRGRYNLPLGGTPTMSLDASNASGSGVPLDSIPSVVKDMTVNLARYWLYGRRPEGGELPHAVTSTHKAALQMLNAIRDGRLTLGLPSGEAAPEPGEIKVRVRPRRFDSNQLDRY